MCSSFSLSSASELTLAWSEKPWKLAHWAYIRQKGLVTRAKDSDPSTLASFRDLPSSAKQIYREAESRLESRRHEQVNSERWLVGVGLGEMGDDELAKIEKETQFLRHHYYCAMGNSTRSYLFALQEREDLPDSVRLAIGHLLLREARNQALDKFDVAQPHWKMADAIECARRVLDPS